MADRNSKKKRVAGIMLLLFMALSSGCGGGGASSSVEDHPPDTIPSVDIQPGGEPVGGGSPPSTGDTIVLLQQKGDGPRAGICSKGRSPSREAKRQQLRRTVIKSCGAI